MLSHIARTPALIVGPARTQLTVSPVPERAERVANVIDRFSEVIDLRRIAIDVFDYSAPLGFRLAVRHPDRLTAIISQKRGPRFLCALISTTRRLRPMKGM